MIRLCWCTKYELEKSAQVRNLAWINPVSLEVCQRILFELVNNLELSSQTTNEPAHEIMVLIAKATSEGSGEPAHHCSHTWTMEVDEGKTKKQTSSPTVWLRMHIWKMNLRRTKSAKISWIGSNDIQFTRIEESITVHLVLMCTWCFHYFQKTGSPSHNFFVEKTFKKCNPSDFKFYLD